jgi:site-specific DNA-cytosine methylase
MKILVGCEESQAVTIELRKLGHEAFSCDVMESSGGYPQWHIQGDLLKELHKGWDMLIAFPPCTHLAVSGARHFEQKIKDGRQQQGIDFFMEMINAPIDKICVENPIGIMSTKYRKPSQIIQPYMFGDKAQKSTCLWLKNLPLLVPTNIVEKGEFIEFVSKKGVKKRQPKWYFDALKNSKNASERSKLRSKTFKGIAKAMATQFTIINQKQLEL